MITWPFRFKRKDRRSGRVAFLIECLLNQNARDIGAAESPAMTRPVIKVLTPISKTSVEMPTIAGLPVPAGAVRQGSTGRERLTTGNAPGHGCSA
jgi:hypothetical protein